jgi:hypothetical protein
MSTKLTSAEETNMELKRNIREMEAKVEEMFKGKVLGYLIFKFVSTVQCHIGGL